MINKIKFFEFNFDPQRFLKSSKNKSGKGKIDAKFSKDGKGSYEQLEGGDKKKVGKMKLGSKKPVISKNKVFPI